MGEKVVGFEGALRPADLYLLKRRHVRLPEEHGRDPDTLYDLYDPAGVRDRGTRRAWGVAPAIVRILLFQNLRIYVQICEHAQPFLLADFSTIPPLFFRERLFIRLLGLGISLTGPPRTKVALDVLGLG